MDGEHFFDLLAEDVVFEYIITVSGYPRRVAGREAVVELYRPYGAQPLHLGAIDRRPQDRSLA